MMLGRPDEGEGNRRRSPLHMCSCTCACLMKPLDLRDLGTFIIIFQEFQQPDSINRGG